MPFARRVSLAAILLMVTTAVLADIPVFTTKAGAIRGYDPVAYFVDEMPVKGTNDFTYEWNGAVWYFASAENRDKFVKDPAQFAPQYGGHCAYAMSSGRLVSIQPDAWHIVDGKLYLNYNTRIQKRWYKDTAGYIARADAQWAEKHATSE